MKSYVLALSVMLLTACSSQETMQQNLSAPDKIQSCIACHGADGKTGTSVGRKIA